VRVVVCESSSVRDGEANGKKLTHTHTRRTLPEPGVTVKAVSTQNTKDCPAMVRVGSTALNGGIFQGAGLGGKLLGPEVGLGVGDTVEKRVSPGTSRLRLPGEPEPGACDTGRPRTREGTPNPPCPRSWFKVKPAEENMVDM